MKAGILCVGTELVTGLIRDANAYFFSQRLVEKGVFPKFVMFVPDEKEDIANGLTFLLDDPEVEVIIVSGGLGPTEDDFTKEVIAELLGRKLVFDELTWKKICQFYWNLRKTEPPENNKKQALIPEGATVLPNELGTAPGLKMEMRGKTIFVVPGVPREAEFFWSVIAGEIHAGGSSFYRTKILKFCGIGESQLATLMKPFLASLPEKVRFAFLPNYGEVWFYLYASEAGHQRREELDRLVEEVANIYGDFLFSPYGDTLEEAIGKILRERRLKLAIAESCTGGLLGDRITNVPGSSDYFERGYVVYSNRAKVEELGVPKEILEVKGAVSEEVACLMAQRAREKAAADIGMGITGIAGPTGATDTKPLGLTYMAVADERRVEVKKYQFGGDRLMNKRFASQFALSMLFLFLRGRG
ncbi:MAG: competence/damage-inducible protein A [Candidatus Atribacteria bacterium]|nr:competence/damage-inducible protein A [Candidatus Atribacteria bacterium]